MTLGEEIALDLIASSFSVSPVNACVESITKNDYARLDPGQRSYVALAQIYWSKRDIRLQKLYHTLA